MLDPYKLKGQLLTLEQIHFKNAAAFEVKSLQESKQTDLDVVRIQEKKCSTNLNRWLFITMPMLTILWLLNTEQTGMPCTQFESLDYQQFHIHTD